MLRNQESLEENGEFVSSVVQELYKCNKFRIPNIVMQWMRNAPQTKFQKACMNITDNIKCFNGIFQNCSKASAYVYKFVRLSSEIVGEIMNKVPDLKVVHLLRDPRGIIRSRVKLGFANNAEYYNVSSALCAEMVADIVETKRLQNIYPGRIKTVLYEDIAENPIDGAKRLYEFARLEFTEEIQNYVYNITLAGEKDNYAYGTVRSNSKKVAYDWRESSTFSNVHIVDTNCRLLYSLMGLKPIDRADMVKDFTYFSRVKTYDLGDYLM